MVKIEISLLYRSEVTLQQIRLGLTFNKDLKELKEGQSLPVMLHMGQSPLPVTLCVVLGCNTVPTAEPLTQARDFVSPLSPLLFESPTPAETEDSVSGREQNIQMEAVSSREKDVEEQELQLTREHEMWKEWKERVEKDITEDLSIIKHNREHLAEWE